MNEKYFLIPTKDTVDFFRLAKKLGNNIALRRILYLLETEGCKTVIVEEGYECLEYKAEYESFYKFIYKKLPSVTTKLHFFSSEVKSLREKHLLEHKENFLGYCVLRPTTNRSICDAVISGTTIIGDKLRPKKDKFLLCQANYISKIKEIEFCVKGLPYLQQDARIGACAQVTLRILSQYFNSIDKEYKSFTILQRLQKWQVNFRVLMEGVYPLMVYLLHRLISLYKRWDILLLYMTSLFIMIRKDGCFVRRKLFIGI